MLGPLITLCDGVRALWRNGLILRSGALVNALILFEPKETIIVQGKNYNKKINISNFCALNHCFLICKSVRGQRTQLFAQLLLDTISSLLDDVCENVRCFVPCPHCLQAVAAPRDAHLPLPQSVVQRLASDDIVSLHSRLGKGALHTVAGGGGDGATEDERSGVSSHGRGAALSDITVDATPRREHSSKIAHAVPATPRDARSRGITYFAAEDLELMAIVAAARSTAAREGKRTSDKRVAPRYTRGDIAASLRCVHCAAASAADGHAKKITLDSICPDFTLCDAPKMALSRIELGKKLV